MKMGIGSAKPHRSVFPLFARYYDAEEVIHKRISSNWQYISNSGPKAMPKTIKNWTINEKVHRIRKTSQNGYSLFCKILRCWRSDSNAHFLRLRRYLKLWPQKLCQKLYKIEHLMKRCIGSAKPHRSVFRFFARYYDAEEVIHQAHFLKSRRYLKQSYAKNYEKLKF